jgi:hypothetical protein
MGKEWKPPDAFSTRTALLSISRLSCPTWIARYTLALLSLPTAEPRVWALRLTHNSVKVPAGGMVPTGSYVTLGGYGIIQNLNLSVTRMDNDPTACIDISVCGISGYH